MCPESLWFIPKKGKHKQWVKLTAAIEKKLKGFEPIIKKRQLFFTPDNSERKATGSYYTPDYIVQYIVKETIEPLCEGKSSQEILDLKVCDPAMGSGHFLNGALNFLIKKYLEALELEKSSEEIPTKAEAKRIVLDKCIFGVDINPRAVKLSKMSLWLESAHPGKKLERLDDQILCGDSLIETLPTYDKCFSYKNRIFQPKGFDGFDAIIGNPPYISELRNNKELFRKFSACKETKPYYESKMDIFYFFICISLDKMNNKGRLGMIVEQYWFTRSNTYKLHGKIYKDSDIDIHINFGPSTVFKNAPGVHSSILILDKEKLRSRNLEKVCPEKCQDETVIQNWLNSGKFEKCELEFNKEEKKFRKRNLFGGGVFMPSSLIQQGIIAPQEYVTRKHIKKDSSLNYKDGIFILTEGEYNSLNLSNLEKSYVRPFYEAKSCNPFKLNKDEKKFLIYLNRFESKDLSKGVIDLPKIKRHLSSFKEIITSDAKPYGLHRPRQEKWFEKGSKVICVRKTKKPCFVWTKEEAYFNQSVLVIKSGWDFLDQLIAVVLNSDISLRILRGIKTQGDQLQVDKEVLLRYPFPSMLYISKFDEIKFRKEYPKIYSEVRKICNGEADDPINRANIIANNLYEISGDFGLNVA